MSKRPDGSLEHEVMMVLWEADGPLLPAEIRDRLPGDLAYTSVATVLGRLVSKGLASRQPAGRAFAYRAVVNESELAIRRISAVLAGASDKTQVLAGFIGSLPKKDIAAVRALLTQSET